MPNHTSTKLIATGTDAELSGMIDFVKSKEIDKEAGKPYAFSLRSIIPMPEELYAVKCPVEIVSEKEYQKAKAKKDASFEDRPLVSTSLPITREMRSRYIKEYGFDNWYSWALANWGTKWDVYEVGEWDRKKGSASIRFQSAWSPVRVIPLLSARFKGLRFVLKFADEGGGFLGYETYEGGDLVEEVRVKWDSKKGIALRKELDCYDEED